MATKSRSARNENAKRLERAVHAEAEVAQQWCADNGVVMSIKNGGHHWTFQNRNGQVEWWPSTGMCVANKRFRKSSIVKAWKQLVPILIGELGAEKALITAQAARLPAWCVDNLYNLDGEYDGIPLEECPFDLV